MGVDFFKEEEILAGTSCGAVAWSALEMARRHADRANRGKLIVAVLRDTGERCLSTWLFQEVFESAPEI